MDDELFEMYDEGLRRILAAVPGEQLAELAGDGAVASVLLAHDLYPVALEQRVGEALEEVRPYLDSHGGDIELLGVEDRIARLRLKGSCDGCGASFATLEAAVESALRAHAPDLDGMDVEGAVAAPPERPPPSSPEWVALPVDPGRGEVATARGLMVANVAGTLLAYRDWCAGCPAPLSGGMLTGGTLTCTACGRSYDLPRAGRERDGELQLEPVPLLRSGGEVKVAVPAGTASAAEEHGREGHCELCPVGLGERHQHLLNLVERRIVCVCATCWSMHSGDPEYRATGGRTLWLDDFALDDETWSSFQVPIGLAMIMRSGLDGEVITLYPSPAGVTEAELDALMWTRLTTDNPALEGLATDAEALIINRLASPPQYVIAPLDECYRLVGMIKARWSGISGGPELMRTVGEFFDGLRGEAVAA